MKQIRNFTFELFLLLISAVFVGVSFKYPTNSKLFPLSVGVIVLVLLTLEIISGLGLLGSGNSLSKLLKEQGDKSKPKSDNKKIIGIFISLFLLVIALKYLSPLIITPIFMFFALVTLARLQVVKALVGSFAMMGFVYVVFYLFLKSFI